MHGGELDYLELLLLALLISVAALALVAKRLSVAYPIVLVIGGLLLSLIPHIPRVRLNPELVFLVILPPLVFSAAFQTSWRDFRNNLAGILMLAFGLVAFTMAGVSLVMYFLVPGFGWGLGLVLGSLVAATDAIAATAIAKRMGLPRRITDLLEAESLVNDGSGLVALKFTLAMVVTGLAPSFLQGSGTLLYLVLAGVLIGLLAGFLVHHVQTRIHDAPIEITVSLITPYLAYLTAERLGCSGVLATLACGLYLGRRSSGLYSLHARIDASAVWRTLDFILNGLVFLILGLQLPSILKDIEGISRSNIVWDGVIFSVAVLFLRFLWIVPGEWLLSRLRRTPNGNAQPNVSLAETFLLGWAGMRGVLSLAAAFSLPEQLADGRPFPFRDLIIFLTSSVIFSTLVVQGLSMPVVIRLLGLSKHAGAPHDEERDARREMARAALDQLESKRQQVAAESESDILRYFERYYRERLASIDPDPEVDRRATQSGTPTARRRIAQSLRDAERSAVIQLRAENRMHEEVLRRLEYELDLLDARFAEPD